MTARRSYWPLSTTGYGIVFVLIGLVFFGGFGWFALVQLSLLQEQSERKNIALAKAELRLTLDNVFEKTVKLGADFSRWEETSQQLSNPTYYTYWRDNRVPSANFVPAYFRSIALYDTTGKVLSHSPSLLPETIRVPVKSHYAQIGKDSDLVYYLYFLPVYQDRRNQLVKGYIGVEIDLLNAIEKLQRFKYVDFSTIHFDSTLNGRVTNGSILHMLDFQVIENHEFQELQNLMLHTLNLFAWVGLALGLVLVYMLIVLFGWPSRKLSRHIDALKDGDFLWLESNENKLPVEEFEKIRLSLNNYQQQLDEQSTAMRENELRMRSVLNNVVDGIITIDDRGTIESINQAACRIFGVSAEVIGKQCFVDLLADECHHDYYAYAGRSLQMELKLGESNSCELTGNKAEGTFNLEIDLSRMELRGKRLFIIVARDISDRKRSEERLKYLANYDELTGLPNRVFFRERLLEAMVRAKRSELLAAVVFFDLDQFKKINDTLGHHHGDILLQTASRRIQKCIREIDTVARFGCDEFVILLENIHHVSEISSVVNKVLKVLESPFELYGQEVFVAASAGITIFPLDDTVADNLVKNADAAMFRAKDSGGNTYEFFTEQINKQAVKRLAMENALRYALERDEFEVYYQPKINLHTGQLSGMEALLRWNHPQLGTVLPCQFIPILEETGMILAVGQWVLKTACEQTWIWNEHLGLDLRISVNVSARQFRQSDLVTNFGAILKNSRLPARNLELEITESILIENVELTIATLTALHDMGIRVSIDDFGTGYSSMAYLKRFPIQTLKIDQSFLRDINTDAEDAAITTAIVALARSLKLSVTAEGIENIDQLKFIQVLRCDEVQGYYFSEPIPADQFESSMLSYTLDHVSVPL